MGHVATRSRMTPEAYLEWERRQANKHEFFHGEVFAMAGASLRHNALCGRIIAWASAALPSYLVLPSDQRVTTADRGRYVYPDVSVVCGGGGDRGCRRPAQPDHRRRGYCRPRPSSTIAG